MSLPPLDDDAFLVPYDASQDTEDHPVADFEFDDLAKIWARQDAKLRARHKRKQEKAKRAASSKTPRFMSAPPVP
eukprot:3942030-Alexandrium_andersonii.AAC.1